MAMIVQPFFVQLFSGVLGWRFVGWFELRAVFGLQLRAITMALFRRRDDRPRLFPFQ